MSQMPWELEIYLLFIASFALYIVNDKTCLYENKFYSEILVFHASTKSCEKLGLPNQDSASSVILFLLNNGSKAVLRL